MTSPFYDLLGFLSPTTMQLYIVAMFLAVVGGTIIDIKGRLIITDMSAEKIGIQKRLLVYRDETVRHPQTGKILGADSQIIGRAMVKQVSPEMTKAELVESVEYKVARFDKVITE